MSSVTAESGMDQHGIQCVHLGLPLGLRHEGPQVQVLWIYDILWTKNTQIHFVIKSNHVYFSHQCHSVDMSAAPLKFFPR